MKDRISSNPGRYSAFIPADNFEALQNGEEFEINLVRNDEPEEEGTPYNKASVLPDDVAAAVCPDIEDPTPADAFRELDTHVKILDTYVFEMGEEINGIKETIENLEVSGGGITQDELDQAMLETKEFAEGFTISKFDELTEYVDSKIGDIEEAIDSIIAIQNELIGGDSI